MKPLVLMTNDDGVLSPGLAAAVAAVQGLGELLVVAPRFQQTTMGRSFPCSEQTGRIERVMIKVNGQDFPAFGIDGSPAQAIAISRQTPLHWQREMDYPDTDWSAAQQSLTAIVRKALTDGFMNDAIIMNINVPDQPARPLKIRWTRQSRFNDSIFVKPSPRDQSRKYLLESVLNEDYTMVARDSDAYALYVDKAISLTPLSWDLTAGSLAENLGMNQFSEGDLV